MTVMITTRLSETLKGWRKQLGLRQVDAAEILGCSKHSIYAWEKGYQPGNLTEIGALTVMERYSRHENQRVALGLPRMDR